MAYRLVFVQNIICEQDFHVIDWENDFVCKYEMRGKAVGQPS